MFINSVILAGGLGKRLEPVSTPEQPKQFHDFFGSGKTLLQDTAMRALEFSKPHKIHTIGNIRHHKLLNKQLRRVDDRLPNKIIYEPDANNTAASIFMSARIVKKGVMAIMPSDHFIAGDFKAAILQAAKFAEQNRVVTFGIKPTEPNVNYGYILQNKFLEKPNEVVVKNLIEQGALWNSGVFVAKAEILLEEFAKYAPEFLNSKFYDMPKMPFDKAIMENTNKMHCLQADFAWDDLGSWESLARYDCEIAYKYAHEKF